MPERWVVNASPLIVLSKIDQQELLSRLADEILVPQTVADEINAGPVDDPGRRFLDTPDLAVIPVLNEPTIIAWDLGAGETAVLSYALANPGWRAVLDDGMARRCAHSLSIPVIGTLGIIIRARRAGLIPAAAPILRALQTHDFRLDEEVIRVALRDTVGEIWD